MCDDNQPISDVSPELADSPARRKTVSPVLGTLASLGVAFFPKCPICWAGYLSFFGIASLNQIPYSPWLRPVLVAVMLINLATVWLRGRSTGRMIGFYLVGAGALAIVVLKMGLGWEKAAAWGVALTLAGSLLSALSPTKDRRPSSEVLSQIFRKQSSDTAEMEPLPQSLRSRVPRRPVS